MKPFSIYYTQLYVCTSNIVCVTFFDIFFFSYLPSLLNRLNGIFECSRIFLCHIVSLIALISRDLSFSRFILILAFQIHSRQMSFSPSTFHPLCSINPIDLKCFFFDDPFLYFSHIISLRRYDPPNFATACT